MCSGETCPAHTAADPNRGLAARSELALTAPGRLQGTPRARRDACSVRTASSLSGSRAWGGERHSLLISFAILCAHTVYHLPVFYSFRKSSRLYSVRAHARNGPGNLFLWLESPAFQPRARTSSPDCHPSPHPAGERRLQIKASPRGRARPAPCLGGWLVALGRGSDWPASPGSHPGKAPKLDTHPRDHSLSFWAGRFTEHFRCRGPGGHGERLSPRSLGPRWWELPWVCHRPSRSGPVGGLGGVGGAGAAGPTALGPGTTVAWVLCQGHGGRGAGLIQWVCFHCTSQNLCSPLGAELHLRFLTQGVNCASVSPACCVFVFQLSPQELPPSG